MRWSTRITAMLLLTVGLGAGGATPALADGDHTLHLDGTASIRDYDDDSADEVCSNRVINLDDRANPDGDAHATLSAKFKCDEARLSISFNGTLDAFGIYHVTGSFTLKEEDCVGVSPVKVCDLDLVGSKPFTFNLVRGMPKMVNFTIDDGSQAKAVVSATFSNGH